MISNEPLFSIEAVPYLVDCDPQDRLLLVAFDAADNVAATASFPLNVPRPLDDAVLEVIGWPSSATCFVAIAYTDAAGLDLQPLQAAAAATGRTAVHLVRAGVTRWRSYLCERARCCPKVGNRYPQAAPGHVDYRPLPFRGEDPKPWRSAMWETWQSALADPTAPLHGAVRSEMARSLFDVPLRDAILAQSARLDGHARPAIRSRLAQITQRSPLATALPAFTCSAALAYLDGEFATAKDLVNAVLSIDEYSLARLLRNGLDMRAPATLLARSFAHFDPVDLLAA